MVHYWSTASAVSFSTVLKNVFSQYSNDEYKEMFHLYIGKVLKGFYFHFNDEKKLTHSAYNIKLAWQGTAPLVSSYLVLLSEAELVRFNSKVLKIDHVSQNTTA